MYTHARGFCVMLSETSASLQKDPREPPAEDRSTKKAKFRDDYNKEIPSEGMSFKDKVLQSTRDREEAVAGYSDDFELSDEDVSVNSVDGLPYISFSPRIQEELSKPWCSAVIIKLLGRHIGYKSLCDRLLQLWNFTNGFDIIDLENEFFMVKFKQGSDVEAVLTGGPWVILGHYLSVQSWNPRFDCYNGKIDSIHAWIRLPGMPIQYYNKKVLRHIGQLIGKVIKIDYCTEAVERGKFARIAVELDLQKPLVSQFGLDGKIQRVEYEYLPRICFVCGKFGHVKDFCPDQIIIEHPNAVNDAASNARETPLKSVKKNDMENPNYGPWMIVGKKGRSKFDNRKSKDNSFSVGRPDIRGSRFQILEDNIPAENHNGDKSPNLMEIDNEKEDASQRPYYGKKVDMAHAVNENFNLNRNKVKPSKESPSTKSKKSTQDVNSKFRVIQAPTSLDPSKHSVVHVVFNHSSTSNTKKTNIRLNEDNIEDMEINIPEAEPPDINHCVGNSQSMKPLMKA